MITVQNLAIQFGKTPLFADVNLKSTKQLHEVIGSNAAEIIKLKR